jgi:glycogen(starch) synthase
MGPSPDDAQRCDADGIRLIDTGLPLDWAETSTAELGRAGRIIAGLASSEGADLVQSHSAAILAEADFVQPVVAVQHSCVASWWEAVRGTPLPTEFRWRRELVGKGLRRAAAVAAPTSAFAEETARIYGLRDVVAVHNGRRPPALKATDQRDVVLTASRLWDEGKNVATLDAAAALVDAPFQAAGSTHGPNGAIISTGHLRLLGNLSADDLARRLAVRPVFASAALYEPFGLSVLEAAQAGCALVLSDIETHRELWGEAALFVPAGDATGFADSINRLLNDRTLRTQIGEAARRRAAHYTDGRMAGGMAELYARVLASAAETARPLQLAGAA